MCLIFALFIKDERLFVNRSAQIEKWTVADNGLLPFAGLFIHYFFSEINILRIEHFIEGTTRKN